MADAAFISPGPNHIYIQHYVSGVPTVVFPLGLASGGVRRRAEPIWTNALNDGQGEAPAEATFQGAAGMISYTLTIFNETTVERCKLFLPNLSQVPGYIPAGGIGSFLLSGKNNYRVLLYRPYAQAQGLQPFINFPSCRLMNAEDLEDNREKRVMMVWEVRAYINACANGDAVVYNYNGDGWPGAIDCT